MMKSLFYLYVIILFITGNSFLFPEQTGEKKEEEESKPLLKVFPIYRREECEWSIRADVCWRCIRRKARYAEKIYFFKDRPYREHGCYTDKDGFFLVNE